MATANVHEYYSEKATPTFHKELFQKGPLKEEYLSGIAVDRFVKFKRSTAFFLTHIHTDHTEGLGSDQFAQYLKQHNFKLYCSEGTRSFIALKHPQLVSQTVVVGLGKPTTIMVPPSQPREQPGGDKTSQPYQATVTTVDANHCFGSVMFLFERAELGVLWRVIYTGDVRMDQAWFSALRKKPERPIRQNGSFPPPPLQDQLFNAFHLENGNVKQIDVVYLDATFYQQPILPSRVESSRKVLEVINKEVSEDDVNSVVVLSLAAQYSAEDIMMEIFNRTGKKVNVEDDIYKVYKQDENMNKCITNDTRAKVFAWRPKDPLVPNAEVDYVFKRRFSKAGCQHCLIRVSEDDEEPAYLCPERMKLVTSVLVIRPSAAFFVYNSEKCNVANGITTCNYDNIESGTQHAGVRVLSSSHSSGSELHEFLRYVQPREVRLMNIGDGGSVEEAERILTTEVVPENRHIGGGDSSATSFATLMSEMSLGVGAGAAIRK